MAGTTGRRQEGREYLLACNIQADGALSQASGPSQRIDSALESLEGCTVWGCWELKRKFRVKGEGIKREGKVTEKILRRTGEAIDCLLVLMGLEHFQGCYRVGGRN